MKLRIVLLFTISVCLFADTNAQNKRYVPGYIIMSQGDTIKGFIKNIGFEERSKYVLFKTTLDGEEVTYDANQVKKYAMGESKHYVSGAVNLRGGESFQKLFLRHLVKGEINLYRLDLEVLENTAPFYQYNSRFYFFNNGEELVQIEEKAYPGILKSTTGLDCSARENGKSYNFNDIGISNLIIQYNNCLGKDAKQLYSENEKQKIQFGFNVGIMSTKLSTNNAAYQDFSMNPGLGYNANLYLDLNILKRTYLRLGLSYFHKTTTGTNIEIANDFYDNAGEIIDLTAKISTDQIIAPVLIKVNVLEKKITHYIIAGGYFGIVINSSSFADQTNFYSIDNEQLLLKERIEPFNSVINLYEVGLKFGTGLEFNLTENKNIYFEAQATVGKNEKEKTNSNYVSNTTIGGLIGLNF